MAGENTAPAGKQDQAVAAIAPHLVVTPFYEDKETGELYVHGDLVRVREAWEKEAHVGPIAVTEKFGDVKSWAYYVLRFRQAPPPPYLTWNNAGLKAVLDYHNSDGTPGRSLWWAFHGFKLTKEFTDWRNFAGGQELNQVKAVEFLESHQDHITTPASADILKVVSDLRGSFKAEMVAEVLPNGGTKLMAKQDRTVITQLPTELLITVPVLVGQTENYENDAGETKGRPVAWDLKIRVRAVVSNEGVASLRFILQDTERLLETIFQEQVAVAEEHLGGVFTILRAAD